jgi:hypothetical protein
MIDETVEVLVTDVEKNEVRVVVTMTVGAGFAAGALTTGLEKSVMEVDGSGVVEVDVETDDTSILEEVEGMVETVMIDEDELRFPFQAGVLSC